MAESAIACLAIADFNIENLVGLLNNDADAPAVQAQAAPYGQVMQILMDAKHPCWEAAPKLVVVWTRPEAAVPAFAPALDGKPVALSEVLEEVDVFAQTLIGLEGRVSHIFVPSWVVPASRISESVRALRHATGVSNLLLHMNARLAQRLSESASCHLLDAQRWLELAGRGAVNPKLWYMAKIAFGQPVFREAVKSIKAALSVLQGKARKLIILDLDDTLWGGVVGETGWEQLTLGGHDPAGEAFVDFQRALKALAERGVLLGLVSKNEEGTALEAFRKHPEMVLRVDDLAGWKINWNDKAQNVADLAAELNLGLQSVVFIDNHPAERSRVREALPEVLVPEWPEDPMLYRQALLALRCFDAASLSEEDLKRTQMYVTERKRSTLKAKVGSVDAWLATLDLKVRFEALSDANLARAAQLMNKTNQMNLSTRRLSEQELKAWAAEPAHRLWTVHVSDRFGDSGLTGLISLKLNGQAAEIVDFVLSCRVMGRKVEEAMVSVAVEQARAAGVKRVTAALLPTPKNGPCLEFWKNSGFAVNGEKTVFDWQISEREYPMPKSVAVEGPFLAASTEKIHG